MSVHDALEAWSEGRLSTERTLELTGCADVDELLRACDSSDVPRPRDETAIEAKAVAACRDPSAARWSVEDGTGCSSRVELRVSVLVGTQRSTIIVADPITGRAHFHEVVPHGSETATAAEAVRALIGARVDLKPALEPGGVPEPLGERGK
ncbi:MULTISPECIES: hypothetical protein [Methylobacterium]|uniref:Uncharacterized protein n=1 Tax=Methylobacterium radiotolerans TaxID=31998 RepID=A0ABV2NL48_9HYPH|nr:MULTISPECIES: hypothetical protein [unclassified Methylobacterium]MBP2504089.1 hypothetical protein [Methylobacterium sp. PvP109]MCX7333119.1 hypothetical protein [Hyphomicrobiales bacterium]